MYIYYASSDTRLHVAASTIDRLLDYVINTPQDEFTSAATVKRINKLVANNNEIRSNCQAKINLNGHAEENFTW